MIISAGWAFLKKKYLKKQIITYEWTKAVFDVTILINVKFFGGGVK